MSTPNAYLAYCQEIDPDSWCEFQARESGHRSDVDALATMLGVERPERDCTYSQYRVYVDEARKVITAYGITFEYEGGADVPGRPYLCAKVYHTDWNGPVSLPRGSFDIATDWQGKILETAKNLGLKLSGECEWKLFAYMDL